MSDQGPATGGAEGRREAIRRLRRFANPNWIGGSGPDRDDVALLLAEYDRLARALEEAQRGWDVETVKRQVADFNALCDAARGYRERAERAEADAARRAREVAGLRRLAKEATNGWACWASRKVEHEDIARMHREIDAVAASGREDGSQ